MMSGEARAPGVLSYAGYRRLFFAQASSTTASSMFQFVVPLLAYDLTGSAGTAGLITAVSLGCSSILGLPAGTLADRLDRSRLVVRALVLQGLVFGALVPLVSPSTGTALALAVGAACAAAVGSVLMPAYAGILRAVVPASRVRDAYTVNQGRVYVVSVVAPALAGLLFAIDHRWVLVVASAFVLLAALVMSTAPRNVPQPGRGQRFWSDMRDGLGYVRRTVRVWTAALGGAVLNLGINGAMYTAVIFLRADGTTSTRIALIEIISSVGAMLGVLLAGLVLRRLSVVAVSTACGAGFAAASAISGVWVGPIQIGVLFGLAAILLPAWNSGVFGGVAADTPHALQGRVQASIQLIAALLAPLAPLVGGLLLDHVTYPAAMGVFSVLVCCGTTVQVLGLRWRPRPRRVDTVAGGVGL